MSDKRYVVNLSSEGNGPTLVLIHGVAGSLHIWDPIIGELGKEHTVVCMDLLGYGHSPKPRITYTPLVHVTAIRNTLKEKGIKPPYTLIGLSMGVNLALEYASRWPEEVQGFIGIGFPYYPSDKAARVGLQGNVWTRLTINQPTLAKIIIPTIWWLGRHHILPAGKFTKIYSPLMSQETLLNPYYVFRSSLIHCMLRNPQTHLLEETGNMSRLFIHGSEDAWATPKEVQKSIVAYKKSYLKIIEGAAHNVVVLKPEKTLSYISEYLFKNNL